MKIVKRSLANQPVSRRHFLRGVGVALALPWMESMPLFAATKSNKPPVRFGCVYFSNGVAPAHWWFKGNGADIELGPVLKPLEGRTQDIVFLKGLYHQKALASTSPHLGRMNLLSGETVSLDPTVIKCGKTFDQILAEQIGGQTQAPSLTLGVEPNELRLEDGISMLYGSCISWESATKPAAKEIYPSRAFDMLVGDGTGRQTDKSILDAVLQETHSLEPKISRSDRVKLDEYLASIRDIETRIERANKEERIEGWRPTLEKPNMPRPANELPQDPPAHMMLMMDLMVLGFQMDKTRVVTLMLNNDLSQMNFKFLQGVSGALHLDLTHNGHAPALMAMYLKTNQFHMEQFAYMIDKMKGIDEGGSTLLDNSLLMFASNLYDGDKHSADEMPILLAGHGGGTLKTGRILNYRDKGDENRRACSLYLSLMDRMGVTLDRFGDTSARLAEL
jgi:hypothetical protein